MPGHWPLGSGSDQWKHYNKNIIMYERWVYVSSFKCCYNNNKQLNYCCCCCLSIVYIVSSVYQSLNNSRSVFMAGSLTHRHTHAHSIDKYRNMMSIMFWVIYVINEIYFWHKMSPLGWVPAKRNGRKKLKAKQEIRLIGNAKNLFVGIHGWESVSYGFIMRNSWIVDYIMN